MRLMNSLLPALVACGLLASATAAPAADAPKEADYYPIITFPTPEGVVLEAGALTMLPDGRLAVSTRRGEIYFVENFLSDAPHAPEKIKYQRFASGLHEILGLAYKDGWLYVTQRCELSRLKDTNGDDRADLFETVSDTWGINGDYHEYAFGSPFDRDGNLWVVLCLTGSFTSDSKFRGWCLRIDENGRVIPTCSGIRSPGGIGFNAQGDCFYTDNQGPWNGTCSLKHLRPGAFMGHPAGNKWYDQPGVKEAMGDKPQEPQSGSRFMTEAKKIPEYNPPVILFPYDKMGKSASGVCCDTSGGKFGPFAGQMFVGDQSHSTIMRCCLEQVKGHYQGACFMFREGFGSGTLPILQLADGSLIVGGTNRGWGSRGNKPFALERLVWTGKVPFEVHEMRAKPDGFELTFTQPVDKTTAADPKSYDLKTYTYIYQASYGSPEVDQTTPKITDIKVADDGRSARLTIDDLQEGHVHELHLPGVRSADGQPLLHNVGYYTLNYIPD